jgi:hypothetical protein
LHQERIEAPKHIFTELNQTQIFALVCELAHLLVHNNFCVLNHFEAVVQGTRLETEIHEELLNLQASHFDLALARLS